MTFKRLTGCLLVLIWLLPAWAGAMPYTDFYVFGDSLSDQGNISLITGQTNPPPEYTDGSTSGRFTNGLNYIDYLAADLGSNISPSVIGGTNYAYGGARTGFHPQASIGAKSLLEQRNAFVDSLGIGTADPKALYIVWAGSNNLQDIIFNAQADPSFDPTQDISNAVADLAGVIGSIMGSGAIDLIVANIPDLGIVPLITEGGPPVQAASELTAGFNSALDQALDAILQASSGTNLMRIDVFSLLGDAFDSHAAFGFNVVNAPCYSKLVEPGGTTCDSPDDYLSWDGFHPTTASHRIIADRMLALVSVPEPGSLALLILGVAGIGLSRRLTATQTLSTAL